MGRNKILINPTVWDQVWNKIWSKARHDCWSLVKEDIKGEFRSHVINQIEDRVWVQLWNQVWEAADDQT